MNGVLSDFWYCLNSYILVSAQGITALEKLIFLHTFLFDSGLFFVLNERRQSNNKNHYHGLTLFPLNNADNFLLQYNAIVLRLESLRE